MEYCTIYQVDEDHRHRPHRERARLAPLDSPTSPTPNSLRSAAGSGNELGRLAPLDSLAPRDSLPLDARGTLSSAASAALYRAAERLSKAGLGIAGRPARNRITSGTESKGRRRLAEALKSRKESAGRRHSSAAAAPPVGHGFGGEVGEHRSSPPPLPPIFGGRRARGLKSRRNKQRASVARSSFAYKIRNLV